MNDAPIGLWIFLGSLVWAVAWAVVQGLAGRVVKNEDESKKAAQDRAEKMAADMRQLEGLIAGLKDYMRDRFDELNEKRETATRELVERLHTLERELPDRLAETRHAVIDKLTPAIGQAEYRIADLEKRVIALEKESA